jgi:hypothetical protein
VSEWACLCGATDCPSCGVAQGLRGCDADGDPLPEIDDEEPWYEPGDFDEVM